MPSGGFCVVGGDAYDEHRKKHPENYPWKVHFGPWRAGYMDITINGSSELSVGDRVLVGGCG